MKSREEANSFNNGQFKLRCLRFSGPVIGGEVAFISALLIRKAFSSDSEIRMVPRLDFFARIL